MNLYSDIEIMKLFTLQDHNDNMIETFTEGLSVNVVFVSPIKIK